jgi:hypothetical protein
MPELAHLKHSSAGFYRQSPRQWEDMRRDGGRTRSNEIPVRLIPADFARIGGGARSQRFEARVDDFEGHLGVAYWD